MQFRLLFIFILSFQNFLIAQTANKIDSLTIPKGFIFERPTKFTFIKNIPGDIRDYSKYTFRKKNTLQIGGMIAMTAVLVAFDQPIINGAQKIGDKLGLSHSSHQATFVDFSAKVGGRNIPLPLNGPTDLNTSMYFLGDGITHFSIAGSFWVYGLAAKNNRARQTATQLTEAILTTGFATQFLKHITGRQSPFASTQDGGLWRVFPNQTDYADNVPGYDAYPSGHLATAMATVTVISSNYPEYKYVKPVGYTLMGLLSFAMLNNGVHWASDYPLAIALGYTFGKIAVTKGRAGFENKSKPENSDENISYGFLNSKLMHPQVSPALFPNATGISLSWKL